jgi:SAM-dependent methyltransferase
VPAPARAAAKDAWNHIASAYARRRWDAAARPARPAATRLGPDLLESLARRFPVEPVGYGYAPDELRARGAARRAALEAGAGTRPAEGASLEIGSADAMTSAELAHAGWRATAIDIDTSRTDARAAAAGVTVRQMDATRLDFPDASFDLVFSFNVFEHLPDPAATFAEMTRVLRPGGLAYVAFTGLRWSPHGAHMYKVIGVPYVTVLFDEGDVLAYLRARGLPDRFPWVNDYSIERFREVFRSRADVLDTLHYGETRNRWHVGLIASYPAVFRAHAPSFDSLLVDSVHARFRRRARP